MQKPTSQAQLHSVLQGAADDGRIAMLDPTTDIMLSSTVTVLPTGKASEGFPWGVIGNGAKLRWNGPVQDMLVYTGLNGKSTRDLVIEGLSFEGGGYAGTPASACLKLSAPLGDSGPIVKFTLRDIFASYAHYGVVLEGGVYEGALYNVHSENHRKDGVLLQHLPNSAFVSNIFFYGLNSSRNYGAGLRTVYSANVFGFSFVLNGEGGIIAPEGIRGVTGGNGENTGESVIVLGHNGYGSVITNIEASSNGVTVCRAYQNGQWVDIGKPCLYAIDMVNAPQAIQQNNHVSYYGAGANPMRVTK